MAFQYINKSSISNLNPNTLQLLEQIDAFPYTSIQPRYSTLGDLHNTLTVEVVDDAGTKIITVQRSIADIKKRVAYLRRMKKLIKARQDHMLEEMRRLEKRIREEDLPRFKDDAELDSLEGVLAQNPGKKDDDIVTFDVIFKISGFYTRTGQNAKVVLALNEKEMMAMTYIHEMMHAYYDSDRMGDYVNVLEYAEEPLAEYGMLSFLQDLSHTYPQHRRLFIYADQSVGRKRYCLGLEHYGFGDDLWFFFGHLDWIEKMYKAKNKLRTSHTYYQSLENIFRSGYPKDKDELYSTAQLLYDLLSKACGLPPKSIGELSSRTLTEMIRHNHIDDEYAGIGQSFSVEFPDGTVIAELKALDTYIHALQKFGLSTVHNLGLEEFGYNIVSDTQHPSSSHFIWQTLVNGKYIIIHRSNAKKVMIANLALIAGELGMPITIKDY